MRLHCVYPVLAFLLCSVSLSTASMYGILSGCVVDVEGYPVSAARIRIEATTRGGSTRVDGSFTILKVPPGTATVTVSAHGYASQTTTVLIAADCTTEISVPLQRDTTEQSLSVPTPPVHRIPVDIIAALLRIQPVPVPLRCRRTLAPAVSLSLPGRESVQECAGMRAGVLTTD